MRDTVFYVRGPFPFGTGRVVSADLVKDTKVTLDLNDEQLRAIANELEHFSGFLDMPALRGIIGLYVPDAGQCKRLSRLIIGVDEWLRSADQNINDLLSSIREWQRGDENRAENLLSSGDLEELEHRLPLIIKTYPCLKRQAKARHLSEVTGLRLEDLEIICDLRPVFDESRSAVEGVIPFTTLKVVCKGVDGLPVALEGILTELEVEDLAKKAAAAVEKLKHLRELLVANNLTIPLLEMTRQGENQR